MTFPVSNHNLSAQIRRRAAAGLFAVTAGLIGYIIPTAAQTVQNGTFGTVQIGQTSTYNLTVGTSSVPSWTYSTTGTGAGCMVMADSFTGCTASGVVTAGENPGASPDAGNFIAAKVSTTTTNTASIAQTLSGLTVGTRYNISFYEAAINTGATAAPVEWIVSLGGTQLATPVVMSPAADSNAAWAPITISFTATSGEVSSPTLQFLAEATTTTGQPIALMEGVKVPEPASILPLAFGVITLVSLRRRGTARSI